MTEQEQGIFNRATLLFGDMGMERIFNTRVIIFGVGGVGSWCAESLVRTGIHHLTIVDSDRVCITNCNRQLMATTKTVGQVKVEALKARLLEISPEADIVALEKMYCAETADTFHLEDYDIIIDCIDSLSDKANLILHACRIAKDKKKAEDGGKTTFLSSMGAALRIDPTKVSVSEFWDVKGDALARALRNKFKRNKEFPACKFLCVYSEETPMENIAPSLEESSADPSIVQQPGSTQKVQTNGSLAHITGIFGMTLSGLALKAIRQDM